MIYHGGDYIGTTVNLASRVTSAATGGETLITDAIAAQTEDASMIEPIGVRMLRGVEEPLRLYRVRQDASQPDPVCGREVPPPPAARSAHAEAELWFCSKGCLRECLAAEAAA